MYSDRSSHELTFVVGVVVVSSLLLVLLLLNKQYILYIILLLAEVTGGCASRLGNMLTLAHFGALAFVK